VHIMSPIRSGTIPCFYLCTSMVEVEPYVEKFEKTYWTSHVQPTLKQLDHMRELWLKGGPSFLK
jgi:hypothetical protein